MRKVSFAKLQGTECFIPAFGTWGSTLDVKLNNSKPRMIGGSPVLYELFRDGECLLLRIQHSGKITEAIVPLTNVQIAVYDEAEGPKEKTVAQVKAA